MNRHHRAKSRRAGTIHMKVLTVLLALVVTVPHVFPASSKSLSLAESFPLRTGKNNLRSMPLVAHALGMIDGHDYTNTREAFLNSYALGYRVFEIDLTLTSDGALIARHDGNMFASLGQSVPERLRDRPAEPVTLAEAMAQPILTKYKTMTIKDVVALMKNHPDTLWITDTKHTAREKSILQFSLLRDAVKDVDRAMLDRVIPQIYNRDMLTDIDSVYLFPDIIYTLYLSRDNDNEVVDFVKNQPRIVAVTLPVDRASKPFIHSLNEAMVASYVHTVNSPELCRQLTSRGVTGIYTDSVTPTVWAETLQTK